jgi:hypothetical protein
LNPAQALKDINQELKQAEEMIADVEQNSIINTVRSIGKEKVATDINDIIGVNAHQQKLKALKFLLNSIPLKVLFIVDADMTELDGMASKVLIESLKVSFQKFKNLRSSLSKCIEDDKGFLPK